MRRHLGRYGLPSVRLWLPFAVLMLAGCGRSAEVCYAEVYDFSALTWPGKASVVLDWLREGDRPDEACELCFMMRTDRSFGYDRLRVEVATVAPDKRVWCDTVTLAAPLPKNIRRMANGWQRQVVFRHGAAFTQPGKWSFSIRQLNTPADSVLQGIQAVGIEIRKQQNN